MEFTTSDLCDAFPGQVQVADPMFREFGGLERFAGPIETLRVFEDNTLVREMLENEGRGRVLVVDGGGSMKVALVGGRLAAAAQRNGWSGIVVNGCVRDSKEIRRLRVGLRALNTVPRRSEQKGGGKHGDKVTFAGVSFTPGHYLYADSDGIILAERDLVG